MAPPPPLRNCRFIKTTLTIFVKSHPAVFCKPPKRGCQGTAQTLFSARGVAGECPSPASRFPGVRGVLQAHPFGGSPPRSRPFSPPP
jgi:hypothetical protein